ncbi:YggN family protein [Shewanella gaetbuli]
MTHPTHNALQQTTNKKWINTLAISTAILAFSSLTPAMAKLSLEDDRCNFTLNYDVTVEPKSLKVSDKGEEKYRVELGQLFVEGESIQLNTQQQQILTEYSDEVSKQVPEVIELVGEAVTMATQAVNMALTPLLGDSAGSKIDELMAGIQKRVDSMAYQHGDQFFLGSTETSLEETFNEEFEQEMEDIISSSIGSLMMSMGSEIMSSEGGSFEEKMNAFASKMENVGNDIEQQMESKAQVLESRANKVCDDFERLVVLESKVREDIPQLASFKLVNLEQPLAE